MSPLPPFRLVALCLLAVGVLLRQAQPFLWQAYAPRLDYPVALLVAFLLPLLAALALPYAAFAWYSRRHRDRPATFLVRDGGFDAPVSALAGRRILRNAYRGVESLTRLALRMREHDYAAEPRYRPSGELDEVMDAFLAMRDTVRDSEAELTAQLERNERNRAELE